MSARTPKLSACAVTMALSRFSSSARMSRLSERTLISITAVSGITLLALPEWMAPTVTMAISCGSALRDTMVCSARTMLEAATIGSAARWGMAPWPPVPVNVTVA